MLVKSKRLVCFGQYLVYLTKTSGDALNFSMRIQIQGQRASQLHFEATIGQQIQDDDAKETSVALGLYLVSHFDLFNNFYSSSFTTWVLFAKPAVFV